MFFPLKDRKLIEVVGIMLRMSGGTMNYFLLLKLLYIIDRESIKQIGRPIVGGFTIAMDFGPLHSEVYDLIKGKNNAVSDWTDFVEKAGRYNVRLKTDPPIAALSRYEVQKVRQVVERFSGMTPFAVSRLTHELTEFKKTHEKKTSRPIPIEDIVDAVGRGSDKLAIVKEARAQRALSQLLGV